MRFYQCVGPNLESHSYWVTQRDNNNSEAIVEIAPFFVVMGASANWSKPSFDLEVQSTLEVTVQKTLVAPRDHCVEATVSSFAHTTMHILRARVRARVSDFFNGFDRQNATSNANVKGKIVEAYSTTSFLQS